MTDEIKTLRKEIDIIDADLLELLSKRADVVQKIGDIKKQIGKDILDPKRRDALLQQKAELAKKYGLDKEFVSKLFMLIHDHAVELQKK